MSARAKRGVLTQGRKARGSARPRPRAVESSQATSGKSPAARTPHFSALEQRLLNDYQRGFPLAARPYAEIAEEQGVTEKEVLACLESLLKARVIGRVGPVFRPHRAGASTLAAMAVPEERLAAVAELVSRYPEVNHNYEREHAFNLWFVVTASEPALVKEVLDDIRVATGLTVLDLPLEQDYHIDLAFPLWC